MRIVITVLVPLDCGRDITYSIHMCLVTYCLQLYFDVDTYGDFFEEIVKKVLSQLIIS